MGVRSEEGRWKRGRGGKASRGIRRVIEDKISRAILFSKRIVGEDTFEEAILSRILYFRIAK